MVRLSYGGDQADFLPAQDSDFLFFKVMLLETRLKTEMYGGAPELRSGEAAAQRQQTGDSVASRDRATAARRIAFESHA